MPEADLVAVVAERWEAVTSERVRIAAASLSPDQRFVLGLALFTDHRTKALAALCDRSRAEVLQALYAALCAVRPELTTPALTLARPETN